MTQEYADNGGVPNEVTWRARAKQREQSPEAQAQAAAAPQPLARNQSMAGGAVQMAKHYDQQAAASRIGSDGKPRSLAEQLGIKVPAKKATTIMRAPEAPAEPAAVAGVGSSLDEVVAPTPPDDTPPVTGTEDAPPVTGTEDAPVTSGTEDTQEMTQPTQSEEDDIL